MGQSGFSLLCHANKEQAIRTYIFLLPFFLLGLFFLFDSPFSAFITMTTPEQREAELYYRQNHFILQSGFSFNNRTMTPEREGNDFKRLVQKSRINRQIKRQSMAEEDYDSSSSGSETISRCASAYSLDSKPNSFLHSTPVVILPLPDQNQQQSKGGKLLNSLYDLLFTRQDRYFNDNNRASLSQDIFPTPTH